MARCARVVMALVVVGCMASPVSGQSDAAARQAYFRAVADFFEASRDEIAILGQWDLPPGEIAAALFVAERAGVSPEALVALRRSGWSWGDLAHRYQLDPSHFHVPLPESAPAGVLADAYDSYRSLSPGQWRTISLTDGEIVTLVNLRLVSQTLRLPAEEVLARVEPGTVWVELYASLLRSPPSAGSSP